MKVSEWLIYTLLFFLPVQLGKHFFLPFSYISGVRIDYLSPAIYLTDIIIIALIMVARTRVKILNSKFKILISILLLLNIFFSLSPFVSIYKTVKILGLILLFLSIQQKMNYKYVLVTLLSSSAIQLFLSIYQITQQRALQGIAYFLGERYFTIATTGIAKVTIQGVEVLRAYGSFSHPNSLGGFFVLLYTYVLFEKKYSKYLVLKYSFLLVSSVLIFLSFSKVAIITFLIVNTYYLSKHLTCKLCIAGRVLGLIVLTGIFFTAQGDPLSIQKRMYLAQNALRTILEYPLFGTGIGAYLIAQSQFPVPYSYQFLQPVHNIYLLLIAEVGTIQFGALCYGTYRFMKKQLFTESGLALIFVILCTGFFDHYWLTLQQNMLVIPVVFGLLQKDTSMVK